MHPLIVHFVQARGLWRGLMLGSVFLLSSCNSAPPQQQGDLCGIFAQRPSWYRAAQAAENKWGTPVPVLMAFVHRESSFQANARPPRGKLLWVIPWRRPSSAYGYAQALKETWQEYLDERGGWFRNRSDFADAVDFIGWYNHHSYRELGLSKTDAYSLYLAYYGGRGGYRRGVWKNNSELQGYAAKVSRRAQRYTQQQAKCPKPRRRFF